MIKVSIVVPCFNEQETISDLVDCLLSTKEKDFELILVDNGSGDRTRERIKKSAEDYKFVKGVYLAKNIGYGGGIKAGLEVASGEYVAWTHADMQTLPSDIFKIVNLYYKELNKKNILKGRRVSKRTFLERTITKFFEHIFQLITKVKIREINAQPKVFNKSIMNMLDFKSMPDDFTFDMYFLLLCQSKGIKIMDHEVFFYKRKFGEAKGGGGSGLYQKFKLGLVFLRQIMTIKRKLEDENSST